MSQQLVLKFAQAGRPDAIETLMNAALQRQGVTARVIQEGQRLFAFLESTHALNQAMAVSFICGGIARLGIKSIHQIEILSYRLGEPLPTWQHSIDLASQIVPCSQVATLTLQPDLVADLVQLPPGESPTSPFKWGSFKRPTALLKKASLVVLPAAAAIAGVYAFQPSLRQNSAPTLSDVTAPAQAISSSVAAIAPLPQMTEIAETIRAQLNATTLVQRAVDTAEGAANLSKSARSGADWNLIAQSWHEAMHLMKAVPLSDVNWEAAQVKAKQYEAQRDQALQQAKELGAIATVPESSQHLPAPQQISPVMPTISQTSFEQIQFGDSYRKVAAALGSSGKGVSWSTRVIYRWEQLDGAFLEAKFEGDKLVSQPATWSPDTVPALYSRIQSGMSLPQIRDILGAPSQATHSVSLMYRWQSEAKGTIEATFVDDQLIYKSWDD